MLLANGADPNVRDKKGQTALIQVGLHSKVEIARLLLTNGVDPNIQDKHGRTALIEAAMWGRVDTVNILLTHRADRDIVDKQGRTALSRAAQQGYNAVVNTLLHAHTEHFNHYSIIPRTLVGDKAVDRVLEKENGESRKRKDR